MVESCPGRIGPISLGAKQTGERSAGNPHAAFDVAGAGNVVRLFNLDQYRRASPRPYRREGGESHPDPYRWMLVAQSIRERPNDERNSP